MPARRRVTCPSANRARRRVTSLMRPVTLLLDQTATRYDDDDGDQMIMPIMVTLWLLMVVPGTSSRALMHPSSFVDFGAM